MLFYDFSKKLLKNFFKNYRNIIDKSDKFEILQFVPGCRNLKLHTLCGTANLCCCANIKEKTFFPQINNVQNIVNKYQDI